MKMGKMLFTNINYAKNEIVNISAVGRNKIKIETKSGFAANKLMKENFFKQNKYTTYIPTFLINKMGVIRRVDKTLTEEEIISDITSQHKVLKVKRMYKKSKENDEINFIKLGTVVLTFDSQTLPEYVYINGCRCKVEPYVSPVLQCYNCLRFNHTNKACKAKERCGRCGGEHQFKNCNSLESKCILCNSTDHSVRSISKKMS